VSSSVKECLGLHDGSGPFTCEQLYLTIKAQLHHDSCLLGRFGLLTVSHQEELWLISSFKRGLTSS
jgi:hypothetical protein